MDIMIETLVYLLAVTCILLLFRFALGYELNQNRCLVSLGVACIALGLLVPFFIQLNVPASYWAVYIFSPVLIFHGKTSIKLGIAVLLWEFSMIIEQFSTNVKMTQHIYLYYGPDPLDVLYQILVLLCLTWGIFLLRKKRRIIRNHIDSIKPYRLILYLGCLGLATFTADYSSDVLPEGLAKSIEFSNGINLGLRCVLATILLIAFILVEILIQQKNGLHLLTISNRACIEEQTKQYVTMNQKENQLKRFFHDYNAHLRALNQIAEKGTHEELLSYIKQLSEMKKTMEFISTNHIISDSIINQYYEQGINEDIEIKVVGRFSDSLAISDSDLCIILSNALKNAYEATSKCEKNRSIEIEISNFNKRAFITIKNPVLNDPQLKGGVMETTKEDKENHGIGIKNIREVIERNNGMVQWTYENNRMLIRMEV